jgi:hypothetical protein
LALIGLTSPFLGMRVGSLARGQLARKGHADDLDAFRQAHFTVLQQASVVSEYVDVHSALGRTPGSKQWQVQGLAREAT